MQFHPITTTCRTAACTLVGGLLLSSAAQAQFSFSVDWHSPTVGMPDSFGGVPITEGDILGTVGGTPALGPLPVPGTAISAGPLGLGLPGYGFCVGHPGGTPCAVEVDALSFGVDHPMFDIGGDYLFSTDEFASGLVGPFTPPDLSSEAPCGDSSADVWVNAMPLPIGPLPPFAAPVGHTGMIDGDGLASCSGAAYPGTGLIEPNFPGFPNNGDNLDAMNFGSVGPNLFPLTGVYFSLDEGFPDPRTGTLNSGSAATMGVTGADILWKPAPGAAPVVFAPATLLGLNLSAQQAGDDLDALAIWENGSGFFEPSRHPYDWITGASDMVLFSVRSGSAVIGAPDSIFGIPIEAGDILTTPLSPAFGGVSPFPGIICAAENLGLVTMRSFGQIADDLNALDTRDNVGSIIDCNSNGIADASDIASGTSTDVDGNGVPDECEVISSSACFCPTAAPCGNIDATAGCANSTLSGALLAATGTSSVANDDLVLTVTSMPLFQPGLIFMGAALVGPLPFGDGLRCAGGGLKRLVIKSAGASGSISHGPGIIAAGAAILPFSVWHFQTWYRDPLGPCFSGYNLSNSVSVTFTP